MSKRIILLAAMLVSGYSLADEPEQSADGIRILVTIDDEGASRIDLSGPPGPGYRRRDRYFASLTAERAANRIADDFGLVRMDEWPIRPLNVFCLVFAIPRDAAVDDLLEALAARPEVAMVQRMNEFVVMARAPADTDDPYADLQHALKTLELRAAHRWTTGEGVDIAVVDTGADYTHPDLQSQIADYVDFVESDLARFRADAHGTAVAGVIAAAAGNGYGIVGVAPASRLAVLKACWYEPGKRTAVCDSFSIAKALSHAIESGADIINLSLAGPHDPLLAALVSVARQRGIVVIAAAPDGTDRGFPAGEPGVIVVDLSPGSSGIAHVDRVLAPGIDILVAMPDGRFDYLSGSSLAAAHVTGIVALMMAIRPDLAQQEIRQRVLNSQQVAGNSVSACQAIAGLVDDAGCREPAALARAGRDVNQSD